MATLLDSEPRLVRLSIEQYHEMLRRSVLREGDSIELMHGLLVRRDRRDKQGDLMVVGPRHAQILGFFAELLRQLVTGLSVHIREEKPITLTGDCEPQPDIAVVKGSWGDYSGGHPAGQDVVLLVEIADSSLNDDRTEKRSSYAQAGIPQYWIVNLRNRSIEVYTQPLVDEQTYETINVYHSGETLPFEIAGQTFNLDVSLLFPPQAKTEN